MSRTKKAGIFFAVMAILMIVLGVNDRDAEFLTTGIGICVVIGLIAYYLQGRKKRCPSCKKLFALQKVEERCIYLCVEEYIPLRIAELCRKRGYTKYRLAQLTGITQTALGNILNQKSMPTMANLERICDAFEVTIAQFFSEDGSRLDLTDEQKEILEIWDGLDEKEREIFMTFIRSLKK